MITNAEMPQRIKTMKQSNNRTIDNIDYSLYVVTDTVLAKKRSLEEIVRLAINGGASVIQYREKNAPFETMVKEATMLHEITNAANIPLIINDNIQVALQVGAEGVHIGQGDMPADQARALIGPNKILGVSVKTLKEALKAVADGADYLGVGTIFATNTKSDAGKPTGLEPLKEIARCVNIPTVGIGGINADNARLVIACGAIGIAVISAIFGAEDPETTARNLRRIVDETRREMQIEGSRPSVERI